MNYQLLSVLRSRGLCTPSVLHDTLPGPCGFFTPQ